MRRHRRSQSGQALVLVAVALLALIGSAALVLLAGSAEWQRNQLQTLADSSALDSALKIGPTCSGAAATTVITEADIFLATQRTRTGALAIAAGTCATPYHGTDTFGGLSADYYYPYHAHEQQVQVVLTLTLPIAFGTAVGKNTTTVTRYAVAEALPAAVASVSAATINCTSGQVNVAGDVAAQNAVNLSGGCALYSHQRLSGGAYSSLGNASVYADGQAWLGGGGACVAGAGAGSTNAICSDGYELSGHVAPACGGVTTSYLTAGNSTVNASPCAAGVGAQPVASVSTALPPDPNTDTNAIATLQGTGGAACAPGGVYPNIVAGGVTWGTGQAPVPVKDASGYWHFKPSCYGYLNFTSLKGGIFPRQTGAELAPTTHFIKPTLPAVSIAGTLLVASLSAVDGVNTITGPAGWTLAANAKQAGEGWNEIWYYANNPGGVTMAQWTVLPASKTVVAQMTEWNGILAAAPLDRTGTTLVSVANTSATVSTSAATTQAGDLVITNDGYKIAAGQTFSRPVGWTGLVTDATNGFSSEYRIDLPAAVASETVTTSQATLWSLGIAAFKAAGSTTGAVLDPGFYYFNGSGFAGGGLCLNGGTLLARDVTIEFVNQAGFSTGDCSVGGGVSCSATTCQFGSTPCSLAACPPNSGADSPNNLTWFAAPCSSAPAAADAASCPGSAWCPAGDRSCWNELIWAPATNTGQVAIKGALAHAWLLGSINWPGIVTDQVNGTSTLAGAISCGTISISAAAGAGTAVGGDAGINTAQVEARLVE